MKISSVKVVTVISAILSLSVIAQAQNRERFGISAKAGGVNAVSGQVMVKREGQAAQLLTSHDDLVSGDIVRTGFGSQAEILLNPGTYLRLAEDSEFVLVDSTLENLLVRFNRGSVIIEATGPDNVSQYIPIVTAQQKFTIMRAGIYRINATPEATEIFVRKGRIALGPAAQEVVKSGQKVVIGGGVPATAKLTKADNDDFDNWSKERGKTLARANQRLNARALSGFLSSSAWGWPGARFGRWGLWTWSPFSSCYTFLPFNYGWGSPYGGSYGMFAGFGGFYPDGSCCRTHVYNQPVIVSNPSYTPGSGGSGTTGSRGSGGSGGSGGSSGGTISTPAPSRGPDPRNPDSGGQWVNKVRDPIN
jgi:FecR protein